MRTLFSLTTGIKFSIKFYVSGWAQYYFPSFSRLGIIFATRLKALIVVIVGLNRLRQDDYILWMLKIIIIFLGIIQSINALGGVHIARRITKPTRVSYYTIVWNYRLENISSGTSYSLSDPYSAEKKTSAFRDCIPVIRHDELIKILDRLHQVGWCSSTVKKTPLRSYVYWFFCYQLNLKISVIVNILLLLGSTSTVLVLQVQVVSQCHCHCRGTARQCHASVTWLISPHVVVLMFRSGQIPITTPDFGNLNGCESSSSLL